MRGTELVEDVDAGMALGVSVDGLRFRQVLSNSAGFTVEEWDEYIRNGMVLEGARGAIPYAEKQGLEQGKLSQARAALR